MQNFKGNLRQSNSSILSVKIRDNQGRPQHKIEFRLTDRASTIKFLRLLKDSYGVTGFTFIGETKEKVDALIKNEMSEELDKLEDWREKTRGLREPDEDLQSKMKNI